MLQRIVLGFVLLAAPAKAVTWHADYVFTAAGVTVMEARVDISPGGPGVPYMIETRTRPRGLATIFFRGEQVSHSEGVWQGARPLPRLHRSSGNWRGSPRRTLLEYSASGAPRILTLEPAQDRERTPIPPEALPGSLDALSAMLLLARQVRDTGRCEARAQIFDGRRLTRLDLTTDPVRQADSGGQPSCVIESRLVAGIPLDRPEDAQPARSVVHFGNPVQPDAPMIPLRVELASRWWGTIQVVLMQVSRGAP
ncbi:DUF3108 domain-containing protein [Roseococcus pinisoli]|uniref:DUF3108 domain-containing protein n=1 Tax=Roseococcus pinisoli TaxID=2835040 RepID=A0ABS5Q7Y9_9PROT|nr:DUF3108 domain-containing protein [Roseococcus pinisoli]MBS7809623.1 DUF3108 domain-containing protein [Roseococcus pinisoli]